MNTLTYFYGQVASGHPWDIKLKENWEERFEESGIVAQYYSQQFKIVYNGNIINAENLGNITYGYFGTAMGFSSETLYWAGGLPNIKSNPSNIFKDYFGESGDDHDWVAYGINLFNKKYGTKYPATI